MELRVGSMVVPAQGGVDLCTDLSLYYETTTFTRHHIGIIVELLEKPDKFDEKPCTYAKVLSSTGHSGWCVSRFLKPASQHRGSL
jgi:hypothetical protein